VKCVLNNSYMQTVCVRVSLRYSKSEDKFEYLVNICAKYIGVMDHTEKDISLGLKLV
jgi:hypothetical protein